MSSLKNLWLPLRGPGGKDYLRLLGLTAGEKEGGKVLFSNSLFAGGEEKLAQQSLVFDYSRPEGGGKKRGKRVWLRRLFPCSDGGKKRWGRKRYGDFFPCFAPTEKGEEEGRGICVSSEEERDAPYAEISSGQRRGRKEKRTLPCLEMEKEGTTIGSCASSQREGERREGKNHSSRKEV